jgi:hypothetical protein
MKPNNYRKPDAKNAHPLAHQNDEMWHKFCALILHKKGIKEVTLDERDFHIPKGGLNLVLLSNDEAKKLTFKLVDDAEALKLVNQK